MSRTPSRRAFRKEDWPGTDEESLWSVYLTVPAPPGHRHKFFPQPVDRPRQMADNASQQVEEETTQ
jgi:hypothetical protein